MRRVLLLLLLMTSLAHGATQTINTIPDPRTALFSSGITVSGSILQYLANEDASRATRWFSNFMYSGTLASTSVSLAHTIPTFTADVNGFYVWQDATSHTYTATRRTYVYVDSHDSRSPEVTFSGGDGCTFASRATRLIFAECTASSDTPTASVGLLPLMWVDTSGTAITTVQDLRKFNPEREDRIYVTSPMFGAKCDGNTDDTTAIAAAITAARHGTAIIFPEGICLTDPLTISKRGITLKGTGWAATGASGNPTTGTKLRARGTQDYVLRIINQFVRVEDMSFDGNFTTEVVALLESSGTSPHHAVLERILIERALPSTSGTSALLQLGGDTNSQVDYVHLRNSVLWQDAAGGGSQATYGMWVKNTNTFQNWIQSSIIVGGVTCLEMRSGSTSFNGLQCEGSTTGIQLNVGNQSFVGIDYYQETDGQQWLKSLNPQADTAITSVVLIHPHISGSGTKSALWYPTVPLTLIGGVFRGTASFEVADPGTDARHCVTAIGNNFNQAGQGFTGALLARVNEEATTNTDPAPDTNSIKRCGDFDVQANWGATAITVGTTGTAISLLKKLSATIDFPTITAGLCSDSAAETDTGATLGQAYGFVAVDIARPVNWTLDAFVSGTSNAKFRWCNHTAGDADPDGAGANYSAYRIAP